MNLEEMFDEYAEIKGNRDIGLSKDKFIELMQVLVVKIKEEEKLQASEKTGLKDCLIPGKIYYINYGGTEIVGRFLEQSTCNYVFSDYIHYWNGYETFKKNKPYCILSGIIEVRKATASEKHNLVRFEIEHDCI